ncbi:hypothetical protein [Nostoc sp.]|uniref:hypothetical protein n=1 Tax=Nostoc sp. TaxID=1180 RepID=UPI002FFB330C
MPRGTRKNSKKPAEKNGSEDLPLLELANQAGDRLDIPAMEQWLWDAACNVVRRMHQNSKILFCR